MPKEFSADASDNELRSHKSQQKSYYTFVQAAAMASFQIVGVKT